MLCQLSLLSSITFDDLPLEIKIAICQYLSIKDLTNISIVNKELYRVSRYDNIWKNIVKKKLGVPKITPRVSWFDTYYFYQNHPNLYMVKHYYKNRIYHKSLHTSKISARDCIFSIMENKKIIPKGNDKFFLFNYLTENNKIMVDNHRFCFIELTIFNSL